MASSQTRLQETSAALEANSESLDDALQRLSTLETRIGETDTRLHANEQALTTTANAFENQGGTLNERLNAIESKVDDTLSLEEKLGGIENRVDSLGSEVATSNSAITAKLESDLASQQTAISGLEASLASNAAKSGRQFESELANLEQRLEAVTNSIGSRATTEDLDQIQQQFAELKNQVSASEETLNSQVAESEATIGDRLANTFDEKFASISSSIDEKRQIDTDNNTRLLRQSVNRMDNQIKAISAASGEADAALELTTALDDRIDEVENALAEIDQNPALKRLDSRISASVAEVDSSVQQLNSRVESSIAEINTSIDSVQTCLLYTSPSPRDATLSRMPSSA